MYMTGVREVNLGGSRKKRAFHYGVNYVVVGSVVTAVVAAAVIAVTAALWFRKTMNQDKRIGPLA